MMVKATIVLLLTIGTAFAGDVDKAKQKRHRHDAGMAAVSGIMTVHAPAAEVFRAAVATAKGNRAWIVTSVSSEQMLLAFETYGWTSGLTCAASVSEMTGGRAQIQVRCHTRAKLATIGATSSTKYLFTGILDSLDVEPLWNAQP